MDDIFVNLRQVIDKRLIELLSFKNLYQQTLFDAANYAIEGKAKRLRPLLVLATLQDFGIEVEKGVDSACALEMIHTYSLIHDDLPCMDDDDFRRGKPSLHKAFTEATAVLTGDFFITYPFEILSSQENLSDSQKLFLIQTLAKKSGGLGMIGGQIVDVESEGKKINREKLEFIHIYKTSALIECALLFGVIIGNIPQKENLSLFGKAIGYAYQIKDDLLDVTGKKSDEKNKKNTSASLLGVSDAKSLLLDLYNKAISYLPKEAILLREIAKKMIFREQ